MLLNAYPNTHTWSNGKWPFLYFTILLLFYCLLYCTINHTRKRANTFHSPVVIIIMICCSIALVLKSTFNAIDNEFSFLLCSLWTFLKYSIWRFLCLFNILFIFKNWCPSDRRRFSLCVNVKLKLGSQRLRIESS